MSMFVALANSLHHGPLRMQTLSTSTDFESVSMALFGHAFGRIVSEGCQDEDQEDTTLYLRDKVEWLELFRVDAIVAVRPHDECKFTVEVKTTSAEATLLYTFETTTEQERTEWTRALLLAKQLSSGGGVQEAFIRFESSGSEDLDSDSDVSVDLVNKQTRHSPKGKPVKPKFDSLTVLQVSVSEPGGKSLSVSLPLSSALRQNTPVHQLKLQALQELRKIGYDTLADGGDTVGTQRLQDYLRHEADWFVLYAPTRDGVWLKDEDRPLKHFIALDLKEPVITMRLEPISTMPFPTIQLSITTTKNKVSDLSQRNYTAYLIDVVFNDMTWQVPRRFKDFHKLHQQLKAKYPRSDLPRLPPKHMFTPLEGDFIVKRRLQLETYIRNLVDHPHFSNDVLVLSFLGVVSTSRDRDLSKNEKSVIHVTALHVGLNYGDIVMFSCRFGASVIQRKVTGAKYDHIGIVVPGASRNLLRILEATGEGIQVYSLKARLMAYSKEVSKSIVVRRFTANRTHETMRRMNEFVAQVEGNPYSILGILQSRGESERFDLSGTSSSGSSPAASPDARKSQTGRPPSTPTRRASTGMLLASPTNKTSSSESQPTLSRRKYFCSSLAAAALKHIGWLETTHTSSYFWPGSFEEGGDIEKYLAPGVTLSNETVVDCRIIEVGLATSKE